MLRTRVDAAPAYRQRAVPSEEDEYRPPASQKARRRPEARRDDGLARLMDSYTRDSADERKGGEEEENKSTNSEVEESIAGRSTAEVNDERQMSRRIELPSDEKKNCMSVECFNWDARKTMGSSVINNLLCSATDDLLQALLKDFGKSFKGFAVKEEK